MKSLPRAAGYLCCSLCIGLVFEQFAPPALADLWGLSTPANGAPASGTENNYNKVFRFDEQGNKLANDIPAGSAGLSFPAGIAVSPSGNIYVSSVGTGSILYYNGQTGTPLASPIGGSPGLFAFLGTAAPSQLAFGPDGNLYVSEYFGSSVRVYNPTTGVQLPDAVTGLNSAGGIAFAANGDLLVGDGFAMAQGQVAKIVRVHNGVQTPWGSTGDGSFYAPAAMLTQANGDVLVVDLLANYIARVSDAGVPGFFASINPPIARPGTNFPSDITFDPDGNIVVSVLGETNPPDNRGALWRYDLNGNILDPDNDATPNEPIVSGIEPIAGIDYTPSLKTLAGDYNGDNAINSADYAKWRSDNGKFVAQGNGADGNSDGVVNAADYVLWRKAAGSGSGTTAAQIPEPTSLALLISIMLYVSCGHRVSR